ncbi:MAG: hypothetical protein NZM33_17935, partial [Bryobacteraceae bacterium]|nr:hypothetical protein [Bryobacteraceae bacterium]
DAFLFGPESRGLPDHVLYAIPLEQRLCLPMVAGSRSLNLSNAVAVMIYEAWRQVGFPIDRQTAGSPVHSHLTLPKDLLP